MLSRYEKLLLSESRIGTQARGALMLQEPASVRFLHVAMLQHDPEGRIAFMHRTAEGKFFPNRSSPTRTSSLPEELVL